MICFAKPGLTEDLYILQKEEFSINAVGVMCIFDNDQAYS
jgi:hypothetical protein